MLLKVRQGWEDSCFLGPGLRLREIAIHAPAPAPVLMAGSCPWELSHNSKPTEGAEVSRRGENRQSAKTGLQVVKTSTGSGGGGGGGASLPLHSWPLSDQQGGGGALGGRPSCPEQPVHFLVLSYTQLRSGSLAQWEKKTSSLLKTQIQIEVERIL